MTTTITIEYDLDGYPVGISGKARNKAEFLEQMDRLRRIGAD